MINRVFSKWLSLNSANSMNHDKVQNWSGYQRHRATDTLPVMVILRIFPLLPLVKYLLPLITLNRYLTRDSDGNFFISVLCTFGFYLDSLNSLNSTKAIYICRGNSIGFHLLMIMTYRKASNVSCLTQILSCTNVKFLGNNWDSLAYCIVFLSVNEQIE